MKKILGLVSCLALLGATLVFNSCSSDDSSNNSSTTKKSGNNFNGRTFIASDKGGNIIIKFTSTSKGQIIEDKTTIFEYQTTDDYTATYMYEEDGLEIIGTFELNGSTLSVYNQYGKYNYHEK